MKTILITAYAVNPYKGSEDGTGWNTILQIAQHQKVIAITRANNQEAIERYQHENPHANLSQLEFLYFDLPYYLRFWKKGARGAMIYCYLWHLFIVFFIKKQKLQFDIAHHLNFHSDWMPSFLWLLGKPFVWGAIGHHPKIPKNYILPVYGWKAYLSDRLKWGVKQFFWKIDPILKITKYKASAIIAINTEVADVLCLKNSTKLQTIPAVATDFSGSSKNNEKFKVLSIGRFIPLKGFDLTLRSFARFYHQLLPSEQKKAELVIVGKGKHEKKLKKLAQELKIGQVTRFVQWIERSKLATIYEHSSVFLFPSHEGAGMVVTEALAFGLPVVCFDNCGPGELIGEDCGIKIPYNDYKTSVENFANALYTLHKTPHKHQQQSANAKQRYLEQFTWQKKGRKYNAIYQNI